MILTAFAFLLGAPVWVLAWEYRHRALGLTFRIRRAVRVGRYRLQRRLAGDDPKSRRAFFRPHLGRHTPRRGTPIPTPAQIQEAAAA